MPNAIVAGDNWGAVLAAAVAIYAVGFVIYGALFSKLWMSLSGYTSEQLQPHRWKMAISPLMPILTAIGLALVLKWARVDNLAMGVVVAAQVWLFLVLSTRLYSFVYSPEKFGLLVMDAIHLQARLAHRRRHYRRLALSAGHRATYATGLGYRQFNRSLSATGQTSHAGGAPAVQTWRLTIAGAWRRILSTAAF